MGGGMKESCHSSPVGGEKHSYAAAGRVLGTVSSGRKNQEDGSSPRHFSHAPVSSRFFCNISPVIVSIPLFVLGAWLGLHPSVLRR